MYSENSAFFFFNKAKLDWNDRATKQAIHDLLLSDLKDYGSSHLRLLTFPGKTAQFEQKAFASLPIKEIICIEGNKDIVPLAKHALKNVPCATVFHTDDKQFLLPTNGYGPSSDISPARARGRLGEGFDFLWFDWMNQLGSGIETSLTLLANNLQLFENAWRKDKPALLYVTLACGLETQETINSLHAAIKSCDPSYQNPNMRELRYLGLTALLNHYLQIRGVSATPFRSLFYKEEKSHSRVMLLVGFKVAQTPFQLKLSECPQPEYWNVPTQKTTTETTQTYA